MTIDASSVLVKSCEAAIFPASTSNYTKGKIYKVLNNKKGCCIIAECDKEVDFERVSLCVSPIYHEYYDTCGKTARIPNGHELEVSIFGECAKNVKALIVNGVQAELHRWWWSERAPVLVGKVTIR